MFPDWNCGKVAEPLRPASGWFMLVLLNETVDYVISRVWPKKKHEKTKSNTKGSMEQFNHPSVRVCKSRSQENMTSTLHLQVQLCQMIPIMYLYLFAVENYGKSSNSACFLRQGGFRYVRS